MDRTELDRRPASMDGSRTDGGAEYDSDSVLC